MSRTTTDDFQAKAAAFLGTPTEKKEPPGGDFYRKAQAFLAEPEPAPEPDEEALGIPESTYPVDIHDEDLLNPEQREARDRARLQVVDSRVRSMTAQGQAEQTEGWGDMPESDKLRILNERRSDLGVGRTGKLPKEWTLARWMAEPSRRWEKAPVVGGFATGARLWEVREAVKAAEDGKATIDQLELLVDFQEELLRQSQEATVGTWMARAAVEFPGFMGDMLLSGGLAPLVKGAAKKGAKRVIGKGLGKALDKALIEMGEQAGGRAGRAAYRGLGEVAARMPVFAHRVASEAVQRKMPTVSFIPGLQPGEPPPETMQELSTAEGAERLAAHMAPGDLARLAGKDRLSRADVTSIVPADDATNSALHRSLLLQELKRIKKEMPNAMRAVGTWPKEAWATAILKATVSQGIEVGSELTGGPMNKLMGRLVGYVAKRSGRSVPRVVQAFQQAGFHGTPTEIVEEVVGELARTALLKEGEVPTLNQALGTVLAIGAVGGASTMLQAVEPSPEAPRAAPGRLERAELEKPEPPPVEKTAERAPAESPPVEEGAPETNQSLHPRVRTRMAAANRLKVEGVIPKIKGKLGKWKTALRRWQHLPGGAEWAPAKELFRHAEAQRDEVKDEVPRLIGAVLTVPEEVDPQTGEVTQAERMLTRDEYELFTNTSINANMVEGRTQREGAPPQPFRLGYETDEQLAQDQGHFQRRVQTTPVVAAALARNEELVRAPIVKRAVEAGFLPAEALDNPAYFHQQVLAFQQVNRLAQKSWLSQKKATFQKRRVRADEKWGEEFDYNTDFIESQADWVTQALEKLAASDWLKDFGDLYDQSSRLKAWAKADNFEALVGGAENVARIKGLRAQIAESRESEDANESDVKAQRKTWVEELHGLDPTWEARSKIAYGLRVLGQEENDDVELDELGAVPWQQIQSLAKEQVPEDEGDPRRENIIAAKSIFKGIADRNKIISDALGKNEKTFKDYIKHLDPAVKGSEGYTLWSPPPGTKHYPAWTVPQQLVAKLQAGVIEAANLTLDQLSLVSAIGAPNIQMVIPTELANELNAMDDVPSSNEVAKAFAWIQRNYKRHILFFPTKYPKYLMLQLFGDTEPVLQAAMGAAAPRYLKTAAQDLKDFHYKPLKRLNRRLERSRRHAAITSTFVQQEIPDSAGWRALRRLYGPKTPWYRKPDRAIDQYYFQVTRFNNWRENMLRHAAFLYYSEQLGKGTLTHYGGAPKADMDAIGREFGNDFVAGYMARNLLGDYGDLSVGGEWLRRYAIPFWSWIEINSLRRAPRIALNVAQYAKINSMGRADAAALYGTLGAMGYASMYGATWAWNHLVWPDKEQDLNDYDRQNPHIVACRRTDGSVRVIRNAGALGDAFEWLGLNTGLSLAPKYFDGTLTGKELAAEMAKDPLSRIVSSVRPEAKIPGELLSGQTRFPDPLTPRQVPRGDVIPQTLGLRDEWNWLKGKVYKDGVRPRPGYLPRLLWGISEPRRTALQDLHALMNRYKKRMGMHVDPGGMGEKNFRNMRYAAMAEEVDQFTEAWRAYLESGKTYEDFRRQMRYVDPLYGDIKKDLRRDFELNFLNGEERRKLKVARDFAAEVQVTLFLYWQRATKEHGGKEVQDRFEDLLGNEIAGHARTLSRTLPLRVDKRQKLQQEMADSLRWLGERGVQPKQLEAALVADMRGKGLKLKTRAQTVRRLRARLEPQ